MRAAAITDQQIRTLRTEAVTAGDWRQVDICDVALGIRPQHTATDRGSIKDSSGRSMTRTKARAACAKVISYAQGEAEHGAAPSRHHATQKKSPAQLEREIAKALASKSSTKKPHGTNDFRVVVFGEPGKKPVHVSRWMTKVQADHAQRNHRAMNKARGHEDYEVVIEPRWMVEERER